MRADRCAPPPASTRRERGKQDRRQRILDTAEALIRQTGDTGFTVAQLAERARLSTPTPYNLFGSKTSILYALLNRSLDPIFAREQRRPRGRDAFAQVLAAAGIGVDAFVDDPGLYVPLYQFLLGAGDPVNRPAFLDRSLQFWRAALAPLAAGGRLPRRQGTDALARMMVMNFVAALELWVHAELDHAQFRAQVLYGVALLLLGFAGEAERPAMQRRLRGFEKQLPPGFGNPS